MATTEVAATLMIETPTGRRALRSDDLVGTGAGGGGTIDITTLAKDVTSAATRDNVAAATARLDDLKAALGTPAGGVASETTLAAIEAVVATKAGQDAIVAAIQAGGGGGAGSGVVDVTDRAGRILGHITVDNFPATQPVSGPLTDAQLRATNVGVNVANPFSGDVSDRAARLLGHVTVDNQFGGDVTDRAARLLGHVAVDSAPNPDVTDRAARLLGHVTVDSAPNPDVTDRTGRLLGHVTVDNASIAVTDSAGTLAKDATLTGGTQKAINRGGAKGATTAADVTSTAEGTDHQALDTQNYHGGVAIDPRDTLDRAARLLGHVTVDSAPNPDVIDRAARLLGHVTVDNASIPVTGTFWQATQPVSLATNTPDVTDRVARLLGHVQIDNFPATQAVSMATQTPDVTDRVAREVGRVRLWDGTDEATVIPRDVASTSADKGLAVIPLIPRRPMYQAVTGEITSTTTVGVHEVMTIWHPATLAKDIMILEIGVNMRIVQTAGTFDFELQFTSTDGTAGTVITAQQLLNADPASGATIRQVSTAAPTVKGAIFQRASFPLPAAATPYIQPDAFILFSAHGDEENAIRLQSGVGEGLRISQNIIAALTTAPAFNLYCRYVERS